MIDIYIGHMRCEIMEITRVIEHNTNWPTFVPVIKTYWLRLIQRTWKRVYRQRFNFWNKLAMSIHIGYGPFHSKAPGLRGMMSCYVKK
jgi:hypothetical protein